MGAMAPSVPDTRQPDEETLLVHVWLVREESHWTAIARDFTVLGTGASPEEAIHRLREFLADYLDICEREGRSVADAKRPLPPKWRAQLRLLQARSIAAGLVRRVRLVREVEMPLHRPAAC